MSFNAGVLGTDQNNNIASVNIFWTVKEKKKMNKL